MRYGYIAWIWLLLQDTGDHPPLHMLSGANDVQAPPLPANLQPWHGGVFDFLGSGVKYKTIVFIPIKIYEVALYVEEESIRAEFRRLYKDGYFQQLDEKTLCKALLQGRFKKLLQIRLLRSVSSSQLTGEIGKDLQPRLAKTGNEALWQRFTDYVSKKSLRSGASFMALVQEDGAADGGIFPPQFSDWQHAEPDLFYKEAAFCEALLDMYLGESALVPDARKKWGQAARSFLPSSTDPVAL